jgi:transcriptional regulator with XRE-family HTH domain
MNYGATIRTIREADGRFNVRQLAKELNISTSYMSRIENNHQVPSMDILTAIAKIFGTTLPFLTFFFLDDEDIPEGKRQLFKAMKPALTEMMLAFMDHGPN